MNTANSVLSLSALRKEYRSGFLGRRRKLVLDDLSLEVARGEIFGFLGPNGSGKTTTLKVVMGFCRADSGTASILGHASENPAWRARVGYLPEQPYLYEFLSGREYLDHIGRLFGLPRELRKQRAELLLERLGLRDAADQRLRSYSKGMQQRAALAQALLNDPELVFLDEPMSGLDPVGRRLVRELIVDLRKQGKTVFFCTHILSDAESLCDRVALLRGGKLLAVGALSEILRLEVAQLELLAACDVAALPNLPEGVVLQERLGERLRLAVPPGRLAAAVACVEQAGGRVLQVNPVRQSLEDFFVREMGAAAGDLG